MTDFHGAVYEPPDPQMPLVAIIISDNQVMMATPVASVAEGEQKLQAALSTLRGPEEPNNG